MDKVSETRIHLSEKVELPGITSKNSNGWMRYSQIRHNPAGAGDNTRGWYTKRAFTLDSGAGICFGMVEFDPAYQKVIPLENIRVIDSAGQEHIIDILGGNKDYIDIRHRRRFFPVAA